MGKIVGIFFSKNYKRFEAGTFVRLNQDEFSFGEKTTPYIGLIQDLFESVHPLEIRAIIGNNGTGKSTLLEILDLFLTWNIKETLEVPGLKIPDSCRAYMFDAEELDPNIFLITDFSLLESKKQKKQKTINLLNMGHYMPKESMEDILSTQQDFEFFRNSILIETLSLAEQRSDVRRIIKLKTHTPESKSLKSKKEILRIIQALTVYLGEGAGLDYGNAKSRRDNEIFTADFYIFNFIRDHIFGHEKQREFHIYMHYLWFFYLSWVSRSDSNIYDAYTEFYENYGRNLLNNFIESRRWMKENDFKISGGSLLGQFLDDKNSETKRFINALQESGYGIRNLGETLKKYGFNFKLSIEVFDLISSLIDNKLKIGDEGNNYYEYFEYDYDQFINSLPASISESEIQEHFLIGIDISVTSNGLPHGGMAHFSTGERQMIYTLLKLNSFFKDAQFNNEHDTLILIDEPESSLHLEWQRSFLYFLLKGMYSLIGAYEGKISLYFATHSPLLISDISKESILFLERKKETSQLAGFTTVKTFDEIVEESGVEIANTFLGNIPEITRCAFFMESQYGRLGEEIINAAIEGKLTRSDEIDIQSLVGDSRLFEYLVLKKISNHSRSHD